MTLFLGLILSLSVQMFLPLDRSRVETPLVAQPEIVLNLKPPLVLGNYVKLGYEITYPGYIEFYLFGPDKQKIWQNFGVQTKGDHYQSIRRDPLESGAVYTFEFWYKGKPYRGSFKA